MTKDKIEQIIEQAITHNGEQKALSALNHIESPEQLRQIMNDAERKHKRQWLRKQVWVYTAAAAVVAVILTIGLQPRYSSEELYAHWSEKIVYESAVARGVDEAQMAFESALTMDTEGKTSEAIDEFKKIATDTSSEYAEDAQWYLAITYIKIGERDCAKEILLQIVKSTSIYSTPAKELLNELNTRLWF